MSPKILPGRAYPLGATPSADGTNFAVASAGDEVTLCLFDPDGVETRLLLPERDGDTRHGFATRTPATTTPKRNPPTWAKNATPLPPLFEG